MTTPLRISILNDSTSDVELATPAPCGSGGCTPLSGGSDVETNPGTQTLAAEAAHAKSWTVLYVEDNLTDAELTMHGLRKACEPSFVVEHFDQLSDALARLAQGGIDVALVDLSLPDASGMDTFQATPQGCSHCSDRCFDRLG